MHINASAIEKVVLFGDSLMAGYGLPKEQHLSIVLENNLKQAGLNIKVINGSVSGSTSSGGLNRADWSLSEPGIDLIILGLGANDMLRGIQPEETERNLEQIIKVAQNKKIKIILAGMVAPDTHGEKYKNGNTLENLQWGLVPGWAKEKDFKALINARLETIDEKVSFKKLIKNYRCVAVADGFYEWKREEKEKIPHYFTREDTNPIYFAGIYENDQFCLITEEAKENINEIHHRQPVILNQADINRYLNLELQGSTFLKERKIPNLIFHEVSKDVNKPTNNSASLIQQV